MIPPDSRTTRARIRQNDRRAKHRQSFIALIVGLLLAAIVGYLIYALSKKLPISE